MAVIDLGFQVVWFGIVDGLDEHILHNRIDEKGVWIKLQVSFMSWMSNSQHNCPPL